MNNTISKYNIMKAKANKIYYISNDNLEGINIGYHNFLKIIIDTKEPQELKNLGVKFDTLLIQGSIITEAYRQYGLRNIK